MTTPGPRIETLTHRLAECPPEFLLPPDQIDVIALVCDLFRALGTDPPPNARDMLRPNATQTSINRLRIISITTWMLFDEWFMSHPEHVPRMWDILGHGLDRLAIVVSAENLLKDPDRREELARLCLAHLGLRPEGETEAQAADRLNTLDSVERQRVVSQTREAEARARKIREQMAKQAAEAAATRYSRE